MKPRKRKSSAPPHTAPQADLMLSGYRLCPGGVRSTGDIVAAVESPAAGPNRKMFVGRIEADGAVDILGPSQVLELEEASLLIEQRYSSCRELLWLFKIIRMGLRRRHAHRDVKDDHLPLDLIYGRKSGSPLGESYGTTRERMRQMRQAARIETPDIDRIDNLCWTSVFEAPDSRIDFEDPELKRFLSALYACMGEVADDCKNRGLDPDERLVAALNALRREGFVSIGVASPADGKRLFSLLIRDAVHMTSKIAGLTALHIILRRVRPVPTQTETDMINLAYGTPKELAGVNRDLFGRRIAAIEKVIADLYLLMAKGAPTQEQDEQRHLLAKILHLGFMYHDLRKEARHITKRRARAVKRKAAEFSENSRGARSEDSPRPVSECTAAPNDVRPLAIRDLLRSPEHRESLDRVAHSIRLQRRTREILDTLMRTDWDVDETARRLNCSEKKVRDAIRHTIGPKMLTTAARLHRKE